MVEVFTSLQCIVTVHILHGTHISSLDHSEHKWLGQMSVSHPGPPPWFPEDGLQLSGPCA